MDAIFVGGLIRGLQAFAAGSSTLLAGLVIAAIFKYYLGPKDTKRLFGSDSILALPQSWLVGMLLPVCSLGVIPIIREMRRSGVRPGAITAFALSAPLFNPLSLLYGLTLSRPSVIIGFAFASLLVVTVLGMTWDYWSRNRIRDVVEEEYQPLGVARLIACFAFIGREICGPTGGLSLLALLGMVILGIILPHGALQSSVEQLDPWAPLTMTAVAVPVYATPMMAMSQLGMMFAHANSPGAAFSLLLLGTGVNLGTLYWIMRNYGIKSGLVWCIALIIIVLGCAYAVDKPLIPPGIKPAGHTHAFDIYTNPFQPNTSLSYRLVKDTVANKIGIGELAGMIGIGFLLVSGGMIRWWTRGKVAVKRPVQSEKIGEEPKYKFDRNVPPSVVGGTALIGLIAFSVVGCYAYYPAPEEVFEEMRLARAEALTGATSGEVKHAIQWIEIMDDWSRKLEVGAFIRRFELRPYQRIQGQILREKLELLEHELEHEELDFPEIREMVGSITKTSGRLIRSYELDADGKLYVR